MEEKNRVIDIKKLIIQEDTILQEDILLDTSLAKKQEIYLKEGVKLTLFSLLEAKDLIPHLYQNKVSIYSEGNNEIKVIRIQMLNDNTKYEEEHKVRLGKNSTISYIDVQLGALEVKSKYQTNLIGDYGKADFHSIYIGDQTRKLDFDYTMSLEGIETDATMITKGVLLDKAFKNYVANIDFKEGSKRANGSESESTILLSDEAHNLSVPVLLCHEEDVSGAHAATAGKIDERKIFYLMSRGFSEREAKKLMVKASFEGVLRKIEDIELVQKIEHEIARRLAYEKQSL